MFAAGASAYAHSMSRFASPAQPDAAAGPDCEFPLPFTVVVGKPG
jgi:hypothetical protein